jgi:transketolase
VFCLTGDGELEEGQIWEAAMFAPHNEVNNLVVICDRNNAQIDGTTEEVISLGDVAAKWKTFGWEVMTMDGNDMHEVVVTLRAAKERSGRGKPIFILMHTAMGKGVDFMEGDYHWHGKAPNAEQAERALAQLKETLGDY